MELGLARRDALVLLVHMLLKGSVIDECSFLHVTLWSRHAFTHGYKPPRHIVYESSDAWPCRRESDREGSYQLRAST